MQRRDVSFPSGPITLTGTLIADPGADPGPAVVLISGSGPIDRDSNMKKLPIDVMRQVARHLETRGITSLRYDKRGVGESGGDHVSSGFHDNVADAAAALEWLRAQPGVDERAIFVIGHSEGSLIATELAVANDDLAGVVLLAGTATAGEQVLRWQATQVSATLPKPVKLLLRLLRQNVARSQAKRLARIKATTTPTTRIQCVKVNAKWLREFMAHDPSISLKAVHVPVLATTGSKDIQVDPSDVERICELVPADCSGQVIENMTHLLRLDDGPPSVRTYKKQVKRPVDPGLLDTISHWIDVHLP